MRGHPALPPRVARPWLAVAAAVWAMMAVLFPDRPLAPLAVGWVEMEGTLASDVVRGRYGQWALVTTDVGPLLLSVGSGDGLAMGDRVRFEGVANGKPGMARGIHHRSSIRVSRLEALPGGRPGPLTLGTAVRDHVMDRLAPFDDGRALLAGFLIGDITELAPSDVEAMRLSGLSHFVAVSGSNVALFLILLALATGPLSLGPKRRAVIGLLGLPIYAAATRYEPSVLRASVMAGIALAGRIVGVVLDAWQLLALAVSVLVLLDPPITANVGFQLSVAATAGVLVGARWPLRRSKVRRALAVTSGAQLAVSPLLIVHFGTIPLFSPLTNLVAAPLVGVSTAVGAVGVVGPGWLAGLAAWLASLVLGISRLAAGLPQIGPWLLAGVTAGALVFLSWRRARPALAVAVALVVIVTLLGTGARLPDVGVVVLDVGQGDAVLVHGGGGRLALVDGGPDPDLLIAKLRSYGVRSLDLVVVTHVHADHVAGLTGLIGRYPIAEIWAAPEPHETPAWREFASAVQMYGLPMRAPSVGEFVALGSLRLKVEGPLRRYASANDQSIVLTVVGPQRTMLLTGDVEVVAQRELGHLRADVLKVPHQGAGTSDPAWLVGVGASEAVIPVGPNQFGHPADWVIELLEGAGVIVRRTDLDGDVAFGL